MASCTGPKKNLVGYWYKPKTLINVRFHPDNTFELNDYDSTSNKPQTFTGIYKVDRPIVTLVFSDKTTQTLNFDKATTGTKGYYLKKDDYYLIKDDRVNNAVPPDSTSK